MKLLLDAHVLIWVTAEPGQLSNLTKTLIADPANTVVVSVVSLWEIAIKNAPGRRSRPPFSADTALGFARESGFSLLSITPEHCVAVAGLPPLHGDPFDRLLIAQAIREDMTLLTRDRQVAAYAADIRLV